MSMRQSKIAILGAGLIGMRHARHVANHPDFQLMAIIDPDEAKKDLGDELGCDFHLSLDDLDPDQCDGVIIATPNSDHVHSGLKACAMGLPALIEKPIADNITDAEQLCAAYSKANLPLLIGHHRRYHPSVQRAKRMIETEELGRPVIASTLWAVRKPDAYFTQGKWRTLQAGGPLLINFIHEADLLIYLFGEVSDFQAITGHAVRNQSVEDSAALTIRFQSGLLATVALSDCALSPWSFEGATGENPNIAETKIAPWHIACERGAFTFPTLEVWSDADGGEGDWSKPLKRDRIMTDHVDPLHAQLTHFSDLLSGRTKNPICSGQDGVNALRLVQDILTSTQQQHRQPDKKTGT